MKKVGLFFGSFNPVHIGHLILGNHLADCTNLDEVWFVVSPHNPLKKKANLLEDHHRLAMVREALVDNDKLKVSDIEFGLPKPSYTVFTLQNLKEKHPEIEFILIMGEDNIRTLHKWKNYEYILENHEIYVYPRIEEGDSSASNGLTEKENVKLLQNVPMMKISSTFIRKLVQKGKDVRYLLSEPVFKYLDEMNFYK